MLVFTGDINLTDNSFDVGYGVGSRIKKGNDPFDAVSKKDGDIWIGNFEGVTADVSIHKDYQKDCFRLPISLLHNCSNLIDYWGIANNHSMEHGDEAFWQMTDALERWSKGVFGTIKMHSITFKHDDKTISVTGLSMRDDEFGYEPQYWNLPELKEIADEINKIKSSDIKIMYIHWGTEFVDNPGLEQIKLAHWLVDIGYDLIIGMHPHVLQGYEVYKDKYIFYSLGNFVFNMSYEPTHHGAVVSYDVRNSKVRWQYIKINDQYEPVVKEEEENYTFENLNQKIKNNINSEWYIREHLNNLKKYRYSNYASILKNLYRYDFSVMKGMISNYIKRRIK